jgi:hypothetical protein
MDFMVVFHFLPGRRRVSKAGRGKEGNGAPSIRRRVCRIVVDVLDAVSAEVEWVSAR